MKISKLLFGVLTGVCALWVGLAQAQQAVSVRAVYRAQGIAAAPDDAAWSAIEPSAVSLMEQMIVPPIGGGSVKLLQVKAMHDGKWFAMRFEWQDESAERAVGVDAFRDSVAVGFPTKASATPPSPFMGDAANPVTIWQWTANRDADAKGEGEFDARYPKTDGVWYFPQDKGASAKVKGWRDAAPVQAYEAKGFGTLAKTENGSLQGTGVYSDGKWSVVMKRKLSDAPSFKPGASSQMIFAVWDGAKREVNGKKAVTMTWLPLVLDAASVANSKP